MSHKLAVFVEAPLADKGWRLTEAGAEALAAPHRQVGRVINVNDAHCNALHYQRALSRCSGEHAALLLDVR